MEVPVWLILDKITRKVGTMPLLFVAGVAYAVRWYLTATITSPGIMVGLQVMQGVTFALLLPLSVQLVSEFTPIGLRTSGQALLTLVRNPIGVANIVGVLISGRLVDTVGTVGLYRVLSYVAFAGGVGFLALILTQMARAKRSVRTHRWSA
jgi:PPP family 3-phenylpropionic acid transporter